MLLFCPYQKVYFPHFNFFFASFYFLDILLHNSQVYNITNLSLYIGKSQLFCPQRKKHIVSPHCHCRSKKPAAKTKQHPSTTPMLLFLITIGLSSQITANAPRPYQIPQGDSDGWCVDSDQTMPHAVHQNPPECGRVCSKIDSATGLVTKGVKRDGTWSTDVPCSACLTAEWPGCPPISTTHTDVIADASTILHSRSADSNVDLVNADSDNAVNSNADTSAENGDTLAQKTLGMQYANGERGRLQNFTKAKYWLAKAATHDNPASAPSAGLVLGQIKALEKLNLSPLTAKNKNRNRMRSTSVLAQSRSFRFVRASLDSVANVGKGAAPPDKVKCTVTKRKKTNSDKGWKDVHERAEYWCQCSAGAPMNTQTEANCQQKNTAGPNGNLQSWVKDSVGGCHFWSSDELCHSVPYDSTWSGQATKEGDSVQKAHAQPTPVATVPASTASTSSTSSTSSLPPPPTTPPPNKNFVASATHTYDAIVPIYWSNNAKEQELQAVVAKGEEDKKKKEELEKKEELDEKKTAHEETAKQTATLAGIATAVVATEKLTQKSLEEKEKRNGLIDGDASGPSNDLGAEIPYVVDVSNWPSSSGPAASDEGRLGKPSSEHRKHVNNNDHQHQKQKQLRWDERKAQNEAKRHQWQRSPFVCPLSTMRMTKYPDEFGAHQGTLESPDAYRRAMMKTIEAAEIVAASTGGHSSSDNSDPPTMAYAPDISATLSLTDPQSVTYQPIMTHFFSDIDGRSKYAIMGTPGADISEFVLVVLAYEAASILTTRATDGQIYQMLSQFLEDMGSYGKSRFAMVTDEAAVASWTKSAEVTDALHPMTPDGKSRAIATSSLPGSLGSEHLRLMMEHSEEYEGIRKGLLGAVIEAFFRIYFDSTHPSQPSLMLIVQKGKHEERGLVIVDRTGLMPEACQSLTPLIVPDTGHQSYYVYHRAAADKHRAAMAEWLMQKVIEPRGGGHPSMGNRLYEDMKRMASSHFDRTKNYIAKGIPRYRVSFGKD